MDESLHYKDPNIESSQHHDISDEEESVFELIPQYLEIIVSSTDIEQLYDAMDWVRYNFKYEKYRFRNEYLLKLIELIEHEEEDIKEASMDLIDQATCYPSAMIPFLMENGLNKYILDKFPYNGTMKFTYNIIKNNDESCLTFMNNGLLDKLQILFDEENPSINTIAQLLNAIALKKVAFNEYGEKIMDLFLILLIHFQSADENVSVKIANAFLAFIQLDETCLKEFILQGMLNAFLQKQLDDAPRYYCAIFKIMTYIAQHDEILAKHLIEEFVVLDFFEHFINEQDTDLQVAGLEFLNALVFTFPEIIDQISIRKIHETLVDLFCDYGSIYDIKKALVELFVIMMAFSSHVIFQQFYNTTCYDVIAENIDFIEEGTEKWVIQILARAFSPCNCKRNEDLINKLRINDDLITWLEQIRAGNDIQLAKDASSLLNHIFPENPIEIEE